MERIVSRFIFLESVHQGGSWMPQLDRLRLYTVKAEEIYCYKCMLVSCGGQL